MTCVCSLAGTAACASCSNNPNSAGQYSNFITWTNSAERTCRNNSIKRGKGVFVCSECGVYLDINDMEEEDVDVFYEPNYCPNCGARVIGGNDA